MAPLNLFIPITKIDAAKRLVYGVATAEVEDRSGEVCDYASTKPLYEKWSGDIAKTTDGKSKGNLRAMHGHVAAGKVTSISFNDADKQIEVCAKVVDDAEWRKVEEGVYTGFSQGGAYVKRWTDAAGLQRYTADPSEISLVDLPCLPTATFQIVKANGAIEARHFKPAATPADGDEWEQVWRSKRDGATFKTKAELRKHHETIDAAALVDQATEPALDSLKTIAAALAKQNHNDESEKMATSGSTKKSAKLATTSLRKGLPTCGRLACLIEELTWVKAACHMEAKQENDGSPVPAMLHQNISNLCNSLVAMVVEETGELVQGQNVDDINDVPNVFNMAAGLPKGHLAALTKIMAGVPSLAKAGAFFAKIGARNNKNDQSKIQAMHDTAVDLGATCHVGADKAHGAHDLGKVADGLAKITGERGAFAKKLDELKPVLDDIAKRVKNIEAQPMPLPLSGQTRVVSKSQDTSDGAPDLGDPAQLAKFVADNRDLLVTEALKLAQRQPQAMIPRG